MTKDKFLLSIIGLTLLIVSIVNYSKIAILTIPKKKPISSSSQQATVAEETFWRNLHEGNYAAIPHTLKLLTAAYLSNPNDTKLAAHLGFTHIWQIAERQRQQPLSPTIVDQIILAKKYFADAVELNANDARLLGFLGASQLIEGKIFNSARQQAQAYHSLKQAIAAWPEFNYFIAGYALSSLPADSNYFKEALEWQWQTLNLCAQEKIDRRNPDFTKYIHLATSKGAKRACWNSWIAPHNFEGFFLNMGDMLVKQGDWQTAIKIYNNAKLSQHYPNWPYRNVLDVRIQQAKENIAKFNHFQTSYSTEQPLQGETIMFNSHFACMACHQQ